MTRALPNVHPDRPEVDGFCFGETAGYSLDQINRMAKTGKIWLTEFRGVCEGRISRFGGQIIAETREEAEAEAKRRGLGETVSGALHSVL